MAGTDTLPEIWRPLMRAPSVETRVCAVCGRPGRVERHHMVKRSAGRLYRHGAEVPKPTITLCGLGNNLRGPGGRVWCHGAAHHGLLHFRWVAGGTRDGPYSLAGPTGGHLEYLFTDGPTPYGEALEMGGWRPLRRWRGC